MVDLENRLGGGLGGVREVVKQWFFQYDLREWVIEDNAFQKAIFEDEVLKQFCAEHGIRLRPVTTGKTKMDPNFGVTTMAKWFNDGRIDLPYLGEDARHKSNLYIRQLVNFDGKPSGTSKAKSDIVMSSWFPMRVIRQWRREERQERRMVAQSESMFPTVTHIAPTAEVPW